ncbi:Xylosyltransferase family GT14 [Gracilaria domingensis]|nr:Xylosyltransferase family GT14 [Gracilaria domingensis]
MILNTLDSIETLLDPNKSWDYYINLSGSDYPLVSPIGIRRLLGEILASASETSFVHFSSARSTWDTLLRHRLRFLHFDPTLGFNPHPGKQLIETYTRHPVVLSKDINITIPKGEAWIIAHRSFCEEVISGTLGRRLLTLFANMQSPAEHFFQTVAWNHRRFNDTTARHSLRLVRWKKADGTRSRQHPVYLDDQSESGKWLYWDSIKASKDLFARKFRTPNSPLMEHIDRYVSGLGENITDTSSAMYFQRVNRKLNCVVSETVTSQQNPIECRKQKTPFKPPDPSPAAPSNPAI